MTASLGKQTAGSVTGAGVAYNAVTNCLTDTFSITGNGGSAPPVICGTNSGYHGEPFTISFTFLIFHL